MTKGVVCKCGHDITDHFMMDGDKIIEYYGCCCKGCKCESYDEVI